MPAEWERHAGCWLAWPCDQQLWGDDLADAQQSFVRLCREIARSGPPAREGSEALKILVADASDEERARRFLDDLPTQFFIASYGDIWLRDTGPIFLRGPKGESLAACFRFNGWGGKYVLPHDDGVATQIAAFSNEEARQFDWVLEGGSIEVDGLGTCLTTRQCLLNPNRNPDLDAEAIEARLRTVLGVTTVLWLDRGLLNDHTDGHVDNLARFVAPGRVVCMEPRSAEDPNADVLGMVAERLETFQDAAGRRLEVIRIPSPGVVLGRSGEIMPASYVNFFIANNSVVVPLYGVPEDGEALAAIAQLFPGRRAAGIPAKALLTGGGAFHCITQPQPIADLRWQPFGAAQ
jgi:agmatine deiminase